MMLSFSPENNYSFKELPVETQNDFLLQFEEDPEFILEDYFFVLKQISYQQLTEELDEIFGCNLIDEIESDYVIELAADILQNGLKNPPIGSEGIHRTMAHHFLNKDMLRFEAFHK